LPNEPSGGSIKVTPPKALAIAALCGAVAGWLIVATANMFDLVPPQVPWTAPVALVLITALVALLAYTTQQRIQVRRERIDPQRAVTFLVLGKASALAGAIVAGGYLAFALMFVTRMDVEAPRDRVIKSAVAVVAGVGLAYAGLRLERACKVPGSDDDDDEKDLDERVDH
jgi:RsiW-degrading membrane proteinase PrsW (M82 family)